MEKGRETCCFGNRRKFVSVRKERKMEFLDICSQGTAYTEQVWKLYEEAFPEAEKKPRQVMEDLVAEGKMELLAIIEKTEEQPEFVGLAMNMLQDEKALLDYFAIVPEKRSGGYGSRAVKSLVQRFAGKTYIFEIEMQDEQAENASDRKRRKAFYLRNGLQETGVFANVYHTDFELLTPDGILSFDEYVEFLEKILGEEGIETLNPRKI